MKAVGGKLHIQVVGLATIAEDVTPELALATIESITVLRSREWDQGHNGPPAPRIKPNPLPGFDTN